MKTIGELQRAVAKRNRLQAKFIQSSLLQLHPEELKDFEAYLNYCLGRGMDIHYLAAAYDLITKDTLNEQIYFKRNKRYRYSTFGEVEAQVYSNLEYMTRYMVGLALTSYLWPNHHAILNFFRKQLPRDKPGNYLEIGPGHGLYFMEANRSSSYAWFLGIDLSQSSIAMTDTMLKSGFFGEFRNYEMKKADFFQWQPAGAFAAIVAGEVLEHVEAPGLFLEKVRRVSHEDAFVFITTCINSPAIDHIHRFENFAQIQDVVSGSGLRIIEQLLIPYNNLTLAECEAQLLPINVALALTPNGE